MPLCTHVGFLFLILSHYIITGPNFAFHKLMGWHPLLFPFGRYLYIHIYNQPYRLYSILPMATIPIYISWLHFQISNWLLLWAVYQAEIYASYSPNCIKFIFEYHVLESLVSYLFENKIYENNTRSTIRNRECWVISIAPSNHLLSISPLSHPRPGPFSSSSASRTFVNFVHK